MKKLDHLIVRARDVKGDLGRVIKRDRRSIRRNNHHTTTPRRQSEGAGDAGRIMLPSTQKTETRKAIDANEEYGNREERAISRMSLSLSEHKWPVAWPSVLRRQAKSEAQALLIPDTSAVIAKTTHVFRLGRCSASRAVTSLRPPASPPKYSALLEPAVKAVQSIALDMVKASQHVKRILQLLKSHRDNPERVTDEIIKEATVVAEKVGLEEDITSMPRIVGKQRHRSNHPAESPS
ncbi:hypothetical protein EVAR_7563_1 [Eumeta japonica]|uniref:Uncharacterized protein n=1 Tax=Eumeta variegata TaxID=151549 RepID=A0A4C1VRX6_EUMVA|nr:hypothetical protein EVAR_7563_1 [Eumeta japonica]